MSVQDAINGDAASGGGWLAVSAPGIGFSAVAAILQLRAAYQSTN